MKHLEVSLRKHVQRDQKAIDRARAVVEPHFDVMHSENFGLNFASTEPFVRRGDTMRGATLFFQKSLCPAKSERTPRSWNASRKPSLDLYEDPLYKVLRRAALDRK